ncbi:sepiapterin reductase [Acrasis kona]|uniref:Sepiapterin reductase n=1 Tax=Acrasis kona TaxID=1008807 RepID=A0AAW2ZAY4_9EUKA
MRQLVIISGASGGFGRAFALSISNNKIPLFPLSNTKYVLLGRNIQSTNETKELLLNQQDGCEDQVSVMQMDLSNVDNVKNQTKDLLDKYNGVYDRVLLLNNAGDIGELKYVHELSEDLNLVQDHMTVNVTSCFIINSLFLDTFKSIDKIIVNVSSLLSTVPMSCWSLYCTSKSARKMMHEVIAREHKEKLRVLNYQPGPLEGTNITQKIKTSGMSDEETQKAFSNMTYISTSDSADKLCKILSDDTFENGSSIDYFDE